MHSAELFLRQQADTAREERRKENMKDARYEIDIYISQGMDREIAVNFVLDENKISIVDKKEVRKFFKYGCRTIYSMCPSLPDIDIKNHSEILVDAI